MPLCSSSDNLWGKTPAATIDDVIELAAAGSPGFAGARSVADALQAFQAFEVLLVLPDHSLIVLPGQSDAETAFAAEVGGRFADLAPGQIRELHVVSAAGPRWVRAMALPVEGGQAILACVQQDTVGATGEGVVRPSVEVALLGALACLVATGEVSRISLQTRVEQLTAEHEAIQGSYWRSLSQAVAERDERLREQEEHASRLRAVMMTAADCIVTVDEHGLIESFNSAATQVFGYEAAEAIGSNASILFADDAGNPACPFRRWTLEEAGESRRGSSRQLLGRRKDGTTFPLELAISNTTFQDRVLTTAILRDITERQAAERQLKRLHAFNRLVLDSAGEGIVGLDCEGKVTFANPAAEHLFGRRAAEMVGTPFHSITHHARTDGVAYPWQESPIQRSVSEGTVHREDSEIFSRQDGTSFFVEYVATPMREEDEIIGAVVTFRDITPRMTLEGQLVQAQKLESIGQLAAGIAHEINTPTQFIGDNLRFLKEAFEELQPALLAINEVSRKATAAGSASESDNEQSPPLAGEDLLYLMEEVPRAISQSLEGVERVAKIVRSMKEFSHPSGEEMQSVDLNRAIESTLTVCRNEWKYVADVVTDFDPDLPLVTCLPGECNQVFLNLVINASHAIAEANVAAPHKKGTISVRTRAIDENVEIRIADTGTGIPESHRNKVFDPFFTTKEVGRGTGQGLAIARSVVVDKHGGSIRFESEIGRGTTFIVQLPVNPSHARRSP